MNAAQRFADFMLCVGPSWCRHDRLIFTVYQHIAEPDRIELHVIDKQTLDHASVRIGGSRRDSRGNCHRQFYRFKGRYLRVQRRLAVAFFEQDQPRLTPKV